MDKQTPPSSGKQPPKYLIVLLVLLAVGALAILWTTPPKKKLPPDPEVGKSSHYGYSRPENKPAETPSPQSPATTGKTAPVSTASLPTPSTSAQPATPATPRPQTAKEFTQAYVKSIYDQVYEKWLPPPSDKPYHAFVRFRLHPDGSISELRVTKPSGDKTVDLSMTKAVEAAAPFKPIPPEFKMKSMVLEVSFNADYPAARP